MIWFYFCKEKKKSCPKNGNFQKFQQFFFIITRFELKLLTLIKSSNIFHWKPAKKKNESGPDLGANFWRNQVHFCEKSKETGIINRLFSYFTWGIPSKGKSRG